VGRLLDTRTGPGRSDEWLMASPLEYAINCRRSAFMTHVLELQDITSTSARARPVSTASRRDDDRRRASWAP